MTEGPAPTLPPHRAVLLLTLLGMATAAGAGCDAGASGAHDAGRPTVFLRGQGEQRLMRGTRPLFIVADSATVGSRTLVAGYEDVPPGDSGRTHKHLHEDELILVHHGRLDVRLGDSTYEAGAGSTVFIPRGTWIGFRARGPDTAGFWFVFNRPSFERCLRALSARPGETYRAPPASALDQLNQECDWALRQ